MSAVASFSCSNLRAVFGYEQHEIANQYDAWLSLVWAIEGCSVAFEIEHRLCQRNGEVGWYLTGGSCKRDARG
jgi:hypothetical protein